mmetsp:Transcript_9453/g.21038  ORF Transcript_9453/g.21038 Transcript_9453/m.21038 type:complete len:83 (+) Transcript_9453:1407-1655(+)
MLSCWCGRINTVAGRVCIAKSQCVVATLPTNGGSEVNAVHRVVIIPNSRARQHAAKKLILIADKVYNSKMASSRRKVIGCEV